AYPMRVRMPFNDVDVDGHLVIGGGVDALGIQGCDVGFAIYIGAGNGRLPVGLARFRTVEQLGVLDVGLHRTQEHSGYLLGVGSGMAPVWRAVAGRAPAIGVASVVVGAGNRLVIVLSIHQDAGGGLTGVADAGNGAGGSARLGEDRKEDGGKDRDDGDDDE